MATNLTKKEKDFADAYLETGNGTQSALKSYDTESAKVASVIASENLAKPRIIEYLQENAEPVAKNMIRLALSAESEQVQVAAGKDVLDRAGYKPVEKSVNLKIEADITNPKAKELADRYESELKQTL